MSETSLCDSGIDGDCTSSALSVKEYVTTGSPFFKCTKLPGFYRVKKQLPYPFEVIAVHPVPDGTEVVIRAGNEENSFAHLKNYSSKMKNNVATFDDFRFLGTSGRGKTFILSITIWTNPPQIVSYECAIKVTVDGPREPRKIKKPLPVCENLPQKIPRPEDFHVHGPMHSPYVRPEILAQPPISQRLLDSIGLIAQSNPHLAMSMADFCTIPRGLVNFNHMAHNQHADPTFNGLLRPGHFANASTNHQLTSNFIGHLQSVPQLFRSRPEYLHLAPMLFPHFNPSELSAVETFNRQLFLAHLCNLMAPNCPPNNPPDAPAPNRRQAAPTAEVPAVFQVPTNVANCGRGGAVANHRQANWTPSQLQSILSAALVDPQTTAADSTEGTPSNDLQVNCTNVASDDEGVRAERKRVKRANASTDDCTPPTSSETKASEVGYKKADKFGMDHLLRFSSS